MDAITDEECSTLVTEYTHDRTLYHFSGSIDNRNVDRFIDLVQPKAGLKVSVFFTTRGGDADGAYRIIRHLHKFDEVRLLIVGKCKSAGTLVALGAHSIAYGPWGELGPLDIQLTKPDEIFSSRSGLDVLQALSMITQHGFAAFREYLVEFLSVDLSTKVAAEIAATITSRLFEPIAAQVNPLSLAEAERSIKIAMEYGTRVNTGNLKTDSLRRLIHDYPSHSFVIDKKEAETLFNQVDEFTDAEAKIAMYCHEKYDTMRYPSTQGLILDLTEVLVTTDAAKEVAHANRDEGSNEEAAEGQQGNNRGSEAGAEQLNPEPREEAVTENGRD